LAKKDVVIKAILHNKTSVIPYHLDFTPPVRKMLTEYYKTDDIDKAVGNYILWLSWRPSLDFQGKRLTGNLIQDEYGVIWNALPENRGYVEYHPLNKPTLSGYSFPDPYAPYL